MSALWCTNGHGVDKPPAPELLLRLLDRWRRARDRLLTSERFQSAALSFPPARWIARRRARRLFDLCAGFVYSQVLLALVQTGWLRRLAESPCSVSELAAAADLPEDSARRLLSAGCELELIEARGEGRYGLAALGAAAVGNPGVLAMVEHHPMFYRDLEQPVRLLRERGKGAELRSFWSYADGRDPTQLGAAEVAAYSRLMAASNSFVAEEIAASYPLRRHKRVLDLGGGNGQFVAYLAGRFKNLQLVLLDLPGVIEEVQRCQRAGEFPANIELLAGNFNGPLPAHGADLVMLVRVVHDHDDAVVARLLRSVFESLPGGGQVLVAEPMADSREAGRIGAAYFGLYLLAMGQGRSRSAVEIAELLRSAGFVKVRRLATRLEIHAQLLTGTRP